MNFPYHTESVSLRGTGRYCYPTNDKYKLSVDKKVGKYRTTNIFFIRDIVQCKPYIDKLDPRVISKYNILSLLCEHLHYLILHIGYHYGLAPLYPPT